MALSCLPARVKYSIATGKSNNEPTHFSLTFIVCSSHRYNIVVGNRLSCLTMVTAP